MMGLFETFLRSVDEKAVEELIRLAQGLDKVNVT